MKFCMSNCSQVFSFTSERLCSSAAGLGVEPLSPVHAESDLMCKETAPILFTEQTLDLVTRVAKFPLKANLGSRKSLVHLKFSVDVRVDGEAFRLNSAPTKPFIVSNEWYLRF